MKGIFVIKGTLMLFGSLRKTLTQLVIWRDIDNEVKVRNQKNSLYFKGNGEEPARQNKRAKWC
jgi:hypothetical protein